MKAIAQLSLVQIEFKLLIFTKTLQSSLTIYKLSLFQFEILSPIYQM